MTQGQYKEYTIGEIVGNLTIIHIDAPSKRKKIYKCQCVCGNIVSRDRGHLSGHYRKNCGCIDGKTAFIDLTGRRFGKLVAIKQIDPKSVIYRRRALWLCQCDCGSTTVRKSPNLISGASVTCKIKGKHSKLGYGEASFNAFYSSTKNNAKKRMLEFSVSKEQVKKISKQNCFYCGCPPFHVAKPHDRKVGEYVYNGLDRVDNTRGYSLDNVVACCGRCNSAKGKESLRDFRDRIKSIYWNWASK